MSISFAITTWVVKQLSFKKTTTKKEIVYTRYIHRGYFMKPFELSLKLTEEQVKMLINRRKGKRGKQTKQQQQEKNKVFK